MEHVQKKRPVSDPIYYHYTSIQGIEGIIRDGSIRATHFSFLNDTQEFIHIFNSLTDHVTQRYEAVDEALLHEISLSYVNTISIDDFFVASFSSLSQDNLSQWRGYGSFALGFSESRLQRLCEAQGFRFTKCEYTSYAYLETLCDKAELSLEGLPGFAEADPAAKALNVLQWLIRTVDLNPLRYKHPGFSEEQEVRVVPQFKQQYKADKISHYTRGDYLIPFVSLMLDEGTLGLCDQIVIGPGVNSAQAKRGIESFARSMGRTIGCIVSSQIPFDPAASAPSSPFRRTP